MSDLQKATLRLIEAEHKTKKLCEARGKMINPSRAAVTTANAKWARAAEDRDRIIALVDSLGGISRDVIMAANCPSTHCNRRGECTSPSDCFSPARDKSKDKGPEAIVDPHTGIISDCISDGVYQDRSA
jgi:hypothetical protein